MPGWAKTAYLPGYAQTQAAGLWVSTVFPTSALAKLGQAWANAMPSHVPRSLRRVME